MTQSDPDNESVGAEMHRSMMAVFCNVLCTSQLPPMTVINLAASALGAIYKEVAGQHGTDDGRSCGWKPNPRTDIVVLQATLAASIKAIPSADLRIMQVVGRA